MAKSTVGLDISSRHLLAAEIENPSGKKPLLVRAHRVALEPSAARDGEAVDLDQMYTALKRLWQEAGFRSKRVVVGIGNQRVLVREHTVPVMPLPQLRQALPYQVADLLPVAVEETVLDFYPIEPVEGSAPPEARGLLIAALKETVEMNVTALTQAGLSIAGVDLSAFAMVRALAPSGVLAGTHVVVSIGTRTTHIIAVKDGVPRFVRIVPAGGEAMIDAVEPLVENNRVSAELAKNKLGVEGVSHPQLSSLSKAMFDSMQGLFGSIRNTVGYYQGLETSDPVETVILLGSESRVPGLPRAVSDNVRLPVRLGSALEGIALGTGVDPASMEAFAYDLAVPIGLALGSD
jgi:type IV pilus assembly protein PilM